MKKLRIWHISDTHGYHNLLTIPKDIDIVIHSGDCSNNRSPVINNNEVLDFIEWYKALPINYKIYVAGNHDTSIEAKLITKETFNDEGIMYLLNEAVNIEGLNIWGSPYTPEFCNWAFNKRRDQLFDIWKQIPEDTHIVISHGPPKGVLDLAYDRNSKLEYCGCKALKSRMLDIQPDLCLFGHIHTNEDNINAGYTKLSGYQTIFSNGSVVTDGRFGFLSSNGNIFEL